MGWIAKVITTNNETFYVSGTLSLTRELKRAKPFSTHLEALDAATDASHVREGIDTEYFTEEQWQHIVRGDNGGIL